MTLQERLRECSLSWPRPNAIDEAADALDAKDARIKELEGALREESMKQLEKFMSELSEDHWAAGWMSGTEHRLWRFMTDESDDGGWGVLTLTQEDRARLKVLSDRCGGWFCERGFVPMADWQIRAREALK